MSKQVIKVVLGSVKKGGRRKAQIIVEGEEPQAAVWLEEYSQEIQQALASKQTGEPVICEWIADPTPASLRPAASAPPARPAEGRPQQGAAQPQRPNAAESPLDKSNPFNFVAWDGVTPSAAEDPTSAQHDQWYESAKEVPSPRLSGTLALKLVARSPIFVPAGNMSDERSPTEPAKFWSCVDAEGNERFGLPGSSVKGAVRSLYEAWTNSRLSVVSQGDYERAIPYRRRTATAWVITACNQDGSKTVRGCDVKFVGQQRGKWIQRAQQDVQSWDPNGWVPPAEGAPDVVDTRINGVQMINFRANLFWSRGHTHRWQYLSVELTDRSATIPAGVVEMYLAGLEHPAYQEHWRRVSVLPANVQGQGGATSHYAGMSAERKQLERLSDDRVLELAESEYQKAKPDLARLHPGTLVFGMSERAKPDELIGFGKNVNFLWPSDTSPKALVVGSTKAAGGFWPAFIVDESHTLAAADPTEAAFGFAAPHRRGRDSTGRPRIESHPFRARIRFETFWADRQAVTMESVWLKKLLSPTGVKLKARAVYLAPGKDGLAASYDDAQPSLRGRKFYWHQSNTPPQVAEQPQNEDDLPLLPLPATTAFTGKVHFDNLTKAELGALLVTVCPDLYWGEDGKYGWKIGKGKPRGFGSVHVARNDVALEVRRDPRDAYSVLSSGVLRSENALDTFVGAFRDRFMPQERAADLEHILRFPKGVTSREYLPPNLGPGKNPPYGWMPGFEKPTGEPGGNGCRPPAMKRTRDIEP